ncbi:MAG: hypothetical protein KJO37_11275, partial [Bacteroidia bacterium]|nr:hypothetical protein [Bacteroidia bacterium]
VRVIDDPKSQHMKTEQSLKYELQAEFEKLYKMKNHVPDEGNEGFSLTVLNNIFRKIREKEHLANEQTFNLR